MPREDWRRYVAPAAFLLAATIAILLIRSGLHAGTPAPATSSAVLTQPHKTVSSPTTTGEKTTTAAGPRFWTVQAGDTFAVISAKSGVPVAKIQQLNPNVKSTSLFIGQKLRLR
ncbi:MAG: LysM peptidoglycan-binding domain-containing protein [Gaiellaceae bacterium]